MFSPKNSGRWAALVVAALSLSVAVSIPLISDVPDSKNFVAHCQSENEVPARDSNAQAEAIFQLSKDGSELSYKLVVANIDNVVAAHIHVAPAGVNGPIVVFLFGNASAGGGRTQGVIGDGTVTAANLIGPLTGMPLSALVTALRNGGAYVNVHTNDGVAPANTGPGDFPGGEVRAQVEVAGPK